ncbi:MAG: hypothetical protein ABH816_01230 [Candidatus Levyibacteriota bacterium]
MDTPMKSLISSGKYKYFSKLIDKYPNFFVFVKKYKFPVVLLISFIVIFTIVVFSYSLITPNSSDSKKPAATLQKTSTVSESSNNNLLKTACSSAINDYPEWTKADTDLIIWENPDKNFYFRNSPEDDSAKLTSPVPSTETLADMDFIGLNEISYATTGDNNWKISTLKLNGLGAYDNSLIYEKAKAVSSINTSPISKNEYAVLIINGNKGVLKHINTNSSKEETILELPSINTKKVKLAVSPKGTYVYLLQNDSLIFFEIASKKQIDKINSAGSAVWVGDEYVLYSGTEGTYVYNLKTKEKSKLDNPGEVTELTFNPKEGGIIAFNESGNTKIVNCQTWQIINTKQGAELKTLTSEKTAITQEGNQFGFWRFKDNDWGVKILEEKSKYVTIWQRY